MRRNQYLELLLLCLSIALFPFAAAAGAEKAANEHANAAGATSTHAKDGAVMVWVPGGTFTMGSIDNVGDADEHPAHPVTLSGYWMYKDDVTVAQYRAFCSATGRDLPVWPGDQYSWAGKSGWGAPALRRHPIVNVSWNDAQAYADWAGVALPSEAQWEYAARGARDNNYPWGGTATALDPTNGWEPRKCANYYNSDRKQISTWPVGSFPADTSWCGVRDLGGNVSDWCADWYGAYASTPVTNPTGPTTGIDRVLRGGSWISGNDLNEGSARRVYRYDYYSSYWNDYIGFRCVSLAPGP